MRPSRARVGVDARAVNVPFDRRGCVLCARAPRSQAVAPVRVAVASIRARANTYDRLRHDSLHFRRHGASFTSFERARDVRGGV